jgi:hypothetical protein
MNENEMTWEQQDAEEVQRMRDRVANFGAFAPEGYAAAMRTIDRQRTDIELLTLEVSRLKRALNVVASEVNKTLTEPPFYHAAALASASDGAGTAAGDTTAGDGDGQS